MPPLRATLAALIVSAVSALPIWTDAARASSYKFAPDFRSCFCDVLYEKRIVWVAVGPLAQRRVTPETVARFLLTEKIYGARAPATGEEIPLTPFPYYLPGDLVLFEDDANPDDQLLLQPDPDRTFRYLGSPFQEPYPRWPTGEHYEDHCLERREAEAVLSFLESVDFDHRRCLDTITDALDIPRPNLEWQDSGCSGGGAEALAGMALALGLLSRSRWRRCPPARSGPRGPWT